MPPRRRSQWLQKRDKAFTLVETMVYTAIITSLTLVTFKTMNTFSVDRKLRAAAIELSSYLEVARSVAFAANEPCVIRIANSAAGIFAPDSTPSKVSNACTKARSIPPSLNLSQITGLPTLKVKVVSGSGTFPLTFSPEGTIRNGATVLITTNELDKSDQVVAASNVDSNSKGVTAWCVEVQAPLATVRRGWRANEDAECNFAIEQ